MPTPILDASDWDGIDTQRVLLQAGVVHVKINAMKDGEKPFEKDGVRTDTIEVELSLMQEATSTMNKTINPGFRIWDRIRLKSGTLSENQQKGNTIEKQKLKTLVCVATGLDPKKATGAEIASRLAEAGGYAGLAGREVVAHVSLRKDPDDPETEYQDVKRYSALPGKPLGTQPY